MTLTAQSECLYYERRFLEALARKTDPAPAWFIFAIMSLSPFAYIVDSRSLPDLQLYQILFYVGVLAFALYMRSLHNQIGDRISDLTRRLTETG